MPGMLDSFVIDQVKRRDKRERDERDRPAVELPLPAPDERPVRRSEEDGRDEKPKRGVVIIDLRTLH
ncbi:MAG: hypothetical protein ACXWLS_06745 [Myxococcaceae bacterium]